MYKTLIILILAIVFLSWHFIFTPEKKVDLTDQVKILQGVSMAMNDKLAVIKYWKENKTLPDLAAWQRELKGNQVDLSQSLVEKIVVAEEIPGAISIYFKNKETNKIEKDINGKKIMLIPVVVDNTLDWICKGNLYRDLLPKRCKYMNSEK